MPLAGCWDRKELNELALTMGLGIDKVGNKYVVTAQVVNPGEVSSQKGGAGSRAPVITFESKDQTVYEAIRKMTKESPRKIYASHLRILVIGESVAREGIGRALDLLSRNQELRTDFYVLIAKGTTAKKVLNVTSSLEKIPSNNMFYALKTSEKAWSATRTVTLDELINELVTPGKEPVVTGVVIKGDKEKGKKLENIMKTNPDAALFITHLGVFKKDKLIGWLNQVQSKAYDVITNKEKTSAVGVPCPKGGWSVYELLRSNTKTKVKMKKGKPEIHLKITAEGNVGEVECQMDLMKTSTIRQWEKNFNQQTETIFTKAIKEVQKKYKADIFGFGETIHRENPKAWKTLRKNWNDRFADLPVHIKVDAKVRRVGTIGNSFLEKVK